LEKNEFEMCYRSKCELTQKIQVEKAMMDQRRENRNAFPPMDFPWITGRSLLSRKKKKDKHTILPVQTRDGSFLKILCAKKSLGYPLSFSKQQNWPGKIGIDIKSIGCF